MTKLSADQSATARSRAYLLLGRLFLRGVTDETLEHVRAVEPLADQLEAFPHEEGEIDLDEAAASYQDLFGFNVFPFQSTYLDETARAGGEETQKVIDFYREAGFPIVKTAESADHLGVELNFLGFLAKIESQTEGEDYRRVRQFSRRFLDDHLLLLDAHLGHKSSLFEHLLKNVNDLPHVRRLQ